MTPRVWTRQPDGSETRPTTPAEIRRIVRRLSEPSLDLEGARTRLAVLVRDSGLTREAFARTVLAGTDRKTVERWLAGGAMAEQTARYIMSIASVRVTGKSVTVRVTYTRPARGPYRRSTG